MSLQTCRSNSATPLGKAFLGLLKKEIETLRQKNDDAPLDAVALNQGGIKTLKRLISQVTSPGPEEVRKGHYR